MPGTKTNERDGTRAMVRNTRVSAYKAREVLDLIRGHDVARAGDILRFCERDVAIVVGKLLGSAIANAANNDDLANSEELFVSACFADEGTTIKRWRPRARGRATRIRKRTCHITLIVSRMPEDRIRRLAAKSSGPASAQRARRVAAGRRAAPRPGDSAEPRAAEEAATTAVVGDAFAEPTTPGQVPDALVTDAEEAAVVDDAFAETAAPETAAPETAAPETAAPETAAPETAAPEKSEVSDEASSPEAVPEAPADDSDPGDPSTQGKDK
ncbi:MAG: 50S ribosomal protein L22 [Acidimicrobiales bacterium]